MRELNDDHLRKLFQSQGHDAPAHDLTARIMARVAVTPIARPTPARPLIGTSGWVAITAGAMALLGLSLLLGATSGHAPASADAMLDAMRSWQLPQGSWPQVMIGGSILVLLFFALDRTLNRSMGTSRVVH